MNTTAQHQSRPPSVPTAVTIRPSGAIEGVVISDLEAAGRVLGGAPATTPAELEAALQHQTQMPNMRLGEVLVALELIDETDLTIALESQRARPSEAMGEILLSLGFITKEQLNYGLAKKMGYPSVDIQQFQVDPKLLAKLPYPTALKFKLLPLCEINGCVVLASEDPTTQHDLTESVAFGFQRKTRLALAHGGDLESQISKRYSVAGLVAKPPTLTQGPPTTGQMPVPEPSKPLGPADRVGSGVEGAIQAMISEAVAQGVSDIHIESDTVSNTAIIRMRKDGRLFPYKRIAEFKPSVLTQRIKVMCDMQISDRRTSQEAHLDFSRYAPELKVTLRVTTLPTHNQGEDVILRILSNSVPRDLSATGLSSENLVSLKRAITKRTGLALCVGPFGAGKTSTLHSWLQHVKSPELKIWTAEDPVEYVDPEMRQIQVNQRSTWTFESALNAILRADPDVIMVSDMREPTTAVAVVEAALNGHMVFSSLNTGTAAETLARLLDMGVDRFTLADALQVIVAQRLVRKMCVDCRVSTPLSNYQLDGLVGDILHGMPIDTRPSVSNLTDVLYARYGKNDQLLGYTCTGCSKCNGTGYRGQIAVHEVLPMDEELKQMIHHGESLRAFQKYAYGVPAYNSLRQDGIFKVLQGLTTTDEIRANCPA